MRCKTKDKNGEMALKIDINKAINRAQLSYLFNVMAKMGFHLKWINRIKLCLESIHYLVQVNEDSKGPISPRRGLR